MRLLTLDLVHRLYSGPSARAVMRVLMPVGVRAVVRRMMLRALLPSARQGGADAAVALDCFVASAPRSDDIGLSGKQVRPQVCEAQHLTMLGFFSSPSGLGEGARLSALALARLGFTVGLIDAVPVLDRPGGVVFPAGEAGLMAGDAGGPLLCHVNPPDLQLLLFRLGLSGRQRPLFAHWVWEVPVMGRDWRDAFRLVHEAWVPSRFVADALKASGFRKPVRLVRYPLPIPEIEPASVVPPRPFSVLTVFAYDSGFERKNPLAAIAAFRLAFGDRADVRLVVKSRGISRYGTAERLMAAAVEGAGNITLIHGDRTAAEMATLLNQADAVLSLHRAEGFGLPLAEAMLLQKPVVATGWSGNLDFMTETSACLVPVTMVPAVDDNLAYAGLRSTWAEASVAAAAEWLRRLEADPALRRRIGAAGRRGAIACIGADAYAAAVATLIR